MTQLAVNEYVIRERLKRTCDDMGLREFCRRNNLDAGNVSNIINDNKIMIDSVAKVLGYEPIKMYMCIG